MKRLSAGVRRLAVVTTAVAALTSAPVTASAQSLSLIRDAETERMLRGMTEPIFIAAGLDPAAVNIYIVGDPSLNAFVAGGQNVFFHTGIIIAAEKPNELIGVIAHETGHITGGHLSRTSEAAGDIMGTSLIGMAIGLAAIAAGAPQVGAAVLTGSQHVAQRSFLAYSRGQEAAADQAALTFLNATKQSGEGLLTFFDRFRDLEIMKSREPDPYVRSHPLSSDRIAALQQGVSSSPYANTPDSAENLRTLPYVKAKLRGFLDRTDIVFRVYPLKNKSGPARYARSVAYFRQGRIPEAVGEIDSLIAQEPENPYFHELKGQILFESGHIAEAVEPYRRSAALAGDEPLILTSLGQALVAEAERTANPVLLDEAIAQLKTAIHQENGLTIAWRHLASAYAAQGDEGMAQLATAELYYHGGNLMEAAQFARRALPKLEEGTPQRARANDILNYAKSALGDRMSRPPNR